MGIAYLENVRVSTAMNYVRARTPRGLRLAMLRNNTRLKGFVKYEAPYRDSDGYLYAWFYEDLDQFDEVSRGD